ncbi:unnamed protein product [Phyllotreta striolata]|uniref:Prolactin regulatory element-binding protein n=1 Tax=Phyllotreta striolata TaxID=444603 RepID=A0A9N9XK27_PHYSR|nr:unnamed protein product [Phyllotreta striolata]
MASKRKNKKNILAKVNFPLYTVQMLTSRHVIVGGGGGTSKTGVENGFEIYEIFHDGHKFSAKEVTRHETGGNVVMNCCAFSDRKNSFLVAGQENYSQLYKVNTKLIEHEQVETVGDTASVRHRNTKPKEHVDNNKNIKKELAFDLNPLDCIQTDFKGSEPLCRVVRINHSGKILATGGTDGDVRLWKFPTMQPMSILKGHTKEIDDIDFSKFDNLIITLAKDGLAILWDAQTGKQKSKLTWKTPEGSKYLYKRCRFGVIEDQKNKCMLYMIANATNSKQASFLQQWIPEENTLKKFSEFNETLSALAVRDDGRFVAVGTMFSGSVSIHIAFSLQKLLVVVGAHSMFVTGLEFLSHENTNHSISSVAETAVLSISVDNQLCIHSVPYRRSIPLWIGIMVLVLVLFITFMLCAYMGL